MHPPEVRAAALELIAAGHNDCEVARMIGIPRGTIRDWRRPTYERGVVRETCPRCWTATRRMRFNAADYSELLALYLCDGHIAIHPRTQRLRIFLDAKYEDIVESTLALLERCFPDNAVGCQVAHGGTMRIPQVYSGHLSCLFPQHGKGMKHQRSIELESWQLEHVDTAPWEFLRGCIRSDGCCFVNRTGPYEYVTYDFCNTSREIVDLFTGACDAVGVEYRVTRWRSWRVRINRRRSVNQMLEHVGLKT